MGTSAIPGFLTSVLASCAVLGVPAAAQSRAPWDARAAEHLLNRAGFGAGSAEIERALEHGREALLEELLAVDRWTDEPFYSRRRDDPDVRARMTNLPEEERREMARMMRRDDRAQLSDYLGWWVERMVEGESPLVERMTLFWHGYFTSSIQVVKSSYEMIQQNQLFREHALGSFRELLHGIARDPALLEYLDNRVSRAGQPNENFARELLELFTLGPGNYAEGDVKEVARAFTGWSSGGGRFRFVEGWHDGGHKWVLGASGELDGDDVLEILLAREACATHLARELLVYFEGVEPPAERVDEYATFLFEQDYRVDRFLGKLFRDPAFYDERVVGQRVASPLDLLVGAARRLELEPPSRMLAAGSSLLGERLFAPPSVQGWPGGRAWITTSALLMRGNLAGLLLGELEFGDVFGTRAKEGELELASDTEAEADAGGDLRLDEPSGAVKGGGMPAELKALKRSAWKPRLNLSRTIERAGARTDGEIAAALCDELLAVAASPELEQRIADLHAEKRAAAGLDGNARSAAHERLLRELAHVILSAPEAQLH